MPDLCNKGEGRGFSNMHVSGNRPATYIRYKQYVFEKNIGMFMPQLD